MNFSTPIMWIALLASACSADPNSSDRGLIECPAHVDRRAECGMIPTDTAAQIRDTNIRICNSWERNYKEEVVSSLNDCTSTDCSEFQVCISEANQLCQSDISSSIDSLCDKVVECSWEGITSEQQCQEALTANQLLYMCLRPAVLEEYIACVRGIECSPDSEQQWYACGVDLI